MIKWPSRSHGINDINDQFKTWRNFEILIKHFSPFAVHCARESFNVASLLLCYSNSMNFRTRELSTLARGPFKAVKRATLIATLHTIISALLLNSKTYVQACSLFPPFQSFNQKLLVILSHNIIEN